ncbi:MAG: glycoside hydrolase family 16 protein [Spirochaetales bacterium]|nr:glycoside hydrolase family 16 protein [Spirochaetales bacterium]
MLRKIFIFLSIFAILLIAGCSNDFISPQDEDITPTSTQENVPASRAWLWGDEFNGSGVPSYFNYDIGGGGWGNNELQYYTNRTSNVNCGGGVLTIAARRENYGGYAFTSARMKSKFNRTYGYIESRMRVPMGQGLWPAFWSLGTNIGSVGWPRCGEIDIMEHVNWNWGVNATIHWDCGGHASYGGYVGCDPSQWNVYSIWWTPSFIRWYINGGQYFEANIANSINSTDEFHRPFFLLFNLAVGGNWPGAPDAGTAFPAYFQIDWVRWYTEY